MLVCSTCHMRGKRVRKKIEVRAKGREMLRCDDMKSYEAERKALKEGQGGGGKEEEERGWERW